MLKLDNIKTYYGNIQALKGISLEISASEIVTLIGANGAGKTTTLMSICGIVPPRSGKVFFEGEQIDDVTPNNIVAKGICQVQLASGTSPGGRSRDGQATGEERTCPSPGTSSC